MRRASKAFLRALHKHRPPSPRKDSARGRDPVNNNGGAHGVVTDKVPKHKIEKTDEHGLSGRSAPGVCGPEGDSVGAPKRGRGRKHVIVINPFGSLGVSLDDLDVSPERAKKLSEVLIPRLKRGRPKITGPRPWEVAGMSRRTWYRRQAEKKEKQK